MLGWSVHGCGVMSLGLRRDDDGRLETTRWVTLLYLPLVPFSRWRVWYVGPTPPGEYHVDETFWFRPVERLPLDPAGVIWTALCGWCLWAVAVSPAVAGVLAVLPPVNPLVFWVLVAACVWPLLVMIWVQRRWRAIVRSGRDDWPAD